MGEGNMPTIGENIKARRKAKEKTMRYMMCGEAVRVVIGENPVVAVEARVWNALDGRDEWREICHIYRDDAYGLEGYERDRPFENMATARREVKASLRLRMAEPIEEQHADDR